MDLKNGSTALFVKDIEVFRQFYIDVLGLTVYLDFGKNVIFEKAITGLNSGFIKPEDAHAAWQMAGKGIY